MSRVTLLSVDIMQLSRSHIIENTWLNHSNWQWAPFNKSHLQHTFPFMKDVLGKKKTVMALFQVPQHSLVYVTQV